MHASDLIPLDAPPQVSSSDLTRWFGVTLGTIRGWVETGRIPPPLKVGPRVHRYDTEAIRAALKAEEASGGPRQKRYART
jgi:predicted DNA-binding transcriptional regulator AlpA